MLYLATYITAFALTIEHNISRLHLKPLGSGDIRDLYFFYTKGLITAATVKMYMLVVV